jgi:hypothetical protein
MNAKPHRRSSGCWRNLGKLTLLSLTLWEQRVLGPAADTKILPEPEPRTVGESFIMPSIRSRDIACAEGPDVRCLEHFLKLPDVINNVFNVHPEQYSEPALPDRPNGGSLNHQPRQKPL